MIKILTITITLIISTTVQAKNVKTAELDGSQRFFPIEKRRPGGKIMIDSSPQDVRLPKLTNI